VVPVFLETGRQELPERGVELSMKCEQMDEKNRLREKEHAFCGAKSSEGQFPLPLSLLEIIFQSQSKQAPSHFQPESFLTGA
jgi:hypothetical protein